MPRPVVYLTACSRGCGANCDVGPVVTETSWLESTGVCTCGVQQNQADGSSARQKPNVRSLLVVRAN